MQSQEDVKRLIHMNSRRLQLLKEQKAYKGVSVDPSVTMEIEDLEVELQRLEHQLEERVETKIVISSKLSHFVPEELEGKLAQIATILNIPLTEISLLRAYDGSIVLHVMMPAEAADRLMAMYEANDPAIRELGIQGVQIIRRELPQINATDLFKQIEGVGVRIEKLERELADVTPDLAPIIPTPTNGDSKKAGQAIAIGDTVQLNTHQTAHVIGLTDLFGQAYADVFIEPHGPTQRIPLTELRPLIDPLATLGGGQTTSVPLFMARLAAFQLKALLTQQGVLSAANFRVTPLPHQVLAQLIGQKISSADIAILTPRPRQKSLWGQPGYQSTKIPLVWDVEPKKNQVTCSTIRTFKGLERPVIVLTELHRLEQWEIEQLMYVAISRARNHLIVIGELPSPAAEEEEDIY
jgi:hypothetical protein